LSEEAGGYPDARGGFEAKQCFELRVASPSHVMTQKSKVVLTSRPIAALHQLQHHLLVSCMWPALEGNRPLAWNGCWSSQWESDSLKQTHDAHRTRTATQSLASRLFNCKHDFPVPPPYLRWDISTTASHVLSIFESRIPSCLTTPSTVIAEPKDFGAERRLQLSCRAHAASFQLSNSTHCTVATRSRLPHLVNTGILAKVGALADLAIPCFCLKPSSHTMAAPFLPSLSTVRRSALYPRAILREQISVRRGGQLGFSSGFVPC
jgi:hypothetical protein